MDKIDPECSKEKGTQTMENDFDTTPTVEFTPSASMRDLDDETIELLMDDKIATGG
jgi:hypothetical protein